MRILYLDCFSGAAGDMLLGAMLDAGLPFSELRTALGSLEIDGYDLTATRVRRGGIAATKFTVVAPEDPPHAHHAVADIKARIAGSSLSAACRDRACVLFDRLADVEAAIHGVPVERVHLHEVGALDSIVDIVGAVFALDWWAADAIVASPVNVGAGTVECAHGRLPVPAPATASLLRGVPIYSSGTPVELVTPTGALLVTGAATRFGPIPPMRAERIGYGAGDREIDGAPNLLRLFVGTSEAEGQVETVTSLQFEVDDMNPQIFGPLMDRLYEAGAREVMYSAVQMKKNRPGTLVSIVSRPERRDALLDVVFRETTTLGVRYQDLQRECLAREFVPVATSAGTVRMKIARRAGAIVNAAPEFDDCADLAAEAHLSVKQVQAMATRAYLDRHPSPTSQRTERVVNEEREPPAQPTAAASPTSEPAEPASDPRIGIEEFMKIELVVAKVLAAERVPNSRKLIKLQVDLGVEERTLVAGIAGAYEAESLVGRTVVVVANLRPATLMGVESNGMILAASLEGNRPALVGFDEAVPPGTRVR